jgi:hypothetical protein
VVLVLQLIYAAILVPVDRRVNEELDWAAWALLSFGVAAAFDGIVLGARGLTHGQRQHRE